MSLFQPGRWIALLAALGLLGAAGWAAKAAEDRLVIADPDAPPPAGLSGILTQVRGGALFRQHCAACHGTEGRGDPVAGVPDLTDHDWLYGAGKTGEIEGVIAHGIRAEAPKTWKLADMPAFGRPVPAPAEPGLRPLAPEEVADVTEFLVALEQRPHDATAAERGRALYLGKAGCYDCHAVDGRGDPGVGAPNLADRIWLYGAGSRAEIARVIREGRHGRCPAWAGRLPAVEIRQIAIYVHGLSSRPAPGAAAPRRGS